MAICAFPGSSILLRLGGRGNHGNSATGQPPAPVTLIESVELITLTTYLSLRPFYRGVGGWDNRSSSCTRDSTQPRNANVSTGSLGCDVYPANGTRDATSQLSSPVSSQRLGHSKCDALSQLFTPDSQPRHGGSNSSGSSAIVTHRHS